MLGMQEEAKEASKRLLRSVSGLAGLCMVASLIVFSLHNYNHYRGPFETNGEMDEEEGGGGERNAMTPPSSHESIPSDSYGDQNGCLIRIFILIIVQYSSIYLYAYELAKFYSKDDAPQKTGHDSTLEPESNLINRSRYDNHSISRRSVSCTLMSVVSLVWLYLALSDHKCSYLLSFISFLLEALSLSITLNTIT